MTRYKALIHCSLCKRLLSILFIFISNFAYAVPTWHATNGPLGGVIVDLKPISSTPGAYYAAACGGGLFKSIDNGAHWQAVNTGLKNKYPAEIAVLDEKSALVVTADGVYKTRNSGKSWEMVSDKIRSRTTNCRLYQSSEASSFDVLPASHRISVLSPNDIYAATEYGSLLHSTDGGSSWQTIPIRIGYETRYVKFIYAVNDNLLYAATWTSGFIKSSDGGVTWQYINNGIDQFSRNGTQALKVVDPNTLIAVVSKMGVIKSNDGGLHWEAINQGLEESGGAYKYNSVRLFVINFNQYLLSANSSLYLTHNGGQSWQAIAKNTYEGNILSFEAQDDSHFISGSDAFGIQQSNDAGATWQKTNDGLNASLVNVVYSQNENSMYAGTEGEGLYKTIDAGAHWQRVRNGLSSRFIRAISGSNNKIYIGTEDGVYISNDSGETFLVSNEGLKSKEIHSLLAIDNKTVYLGTDRELYYSNDGGSTWTWLSIFSPYDPPTEKRPITSIISIADDKLEAGVAGENFAYPIRSGRYGNNWNMDTCGWVFEGGYSSNVSLAAVSPDALYATVGPNIFRSSNGRCWQKITGNLPKANWHTITLFNNTIFVGANGEGFHSEGVYQLTPLSGTWRPVNDGLGNIPIYQLYPAKQALFAATYGGGVYTAR